MTNMKAEVNKIKARLTNLLCKTKASNGLVFQLSPNGISVYRVKRNPVTLTPEQWGKIIAVAPELSKYIAEHRGSFEDGR